MNQLQDIPMFFIGDNHGEYSEMFELIKNHSLSNCYLIHLGDGGEGFLEMPKQFRQFVYLNTFFESRNIHYMSIRGNHSDPIYFEGSTRFSLSHFNLIEDYTLMDYKDKVIQFVGGAISIDRKSRIEGRSYWKKEPVKLDLEKCQKCDILITHTAPSRCFPQEINDMVRYWARNDESLLKDLAEERVVMDEIFNKCKPSLHIYGHFHSSHTEVVQDCMHKLLDINEIWEYR